MNSVAIISCLWLVLIVFWLVSALSAKKTVRRSVRSWVFRVAAVIVILFFIQHSGTGNSVMYWMPLPNPALNALGVVLCAAGVTFAIWARVYLGRNWGMPMSLKENPELVTTGPYAFVRHPIYTGVLLAMLGCAFGAGLWWLAIFVAAGMYFIYSAVVEEKLMVQQFPNQYPDYKKRTKMLIPFVL
jgi:protein-S-isoprenylcysteine O-methyltransferase Ste14